MLNYTARPVKHKLRKKTYEWLKGVHERRELLKPEQPARSFVYFALNGIPDDMASTVVDWNDPRIKFELGLEKRISVFLCRAINHPIAA
jgi:hypothetical protein